MKKHTLRCAPTIETDRLVLRGHSRVLSPDCFGKGYAAEALHAPLAWFDEHNENQQTVCMIEPNNAASIRVAEKCGYSFHLNATYNTAELAIYKRNRS